MLSISAVSLLISCIPFPSITKRLVLRSPTVKGACSSWRSCSVCFEAVLLVVATSSWWLHLSAVMKLPSVPLVILFALVFSFINESMVYLFIHLHFKLWLDVEYVPFMKRVLGSCASDSLSLVGSENPVCVYCHGWGSWSHFCQSLCEYIFVIREQRDGRWRGGAGLQLSAEGSWVASLSKPQGSYSRNVKRVGCWCPHQKRQYPAGPSAGPMPGLGGQSCTDSRCQKGGGGGAGCELLFGLLDRVMGAKYSRAEVSPFLSIWEPICGPEGHCLHESCRHTPGPGLTQGV